MVVGLSYKDGLMDQLISIAIGMNTNTVLVMCMGNIGLVMNSFINTLRAKRQDIQHQQ